MTGSSVTNQNNKLEMPKVRCKGEMCEGNTGAGENIAVVVFDEKKALTVNKSSLYV